MPLKYLDNFWRSIEVLLINCKVELKLKWSKYCVLSANGNDNANVNYNANNIIFLSMTQNYMFPLSFYQQKIIKNYLNFLAKDLKKQFIRMNIKQKVRIKIQQMNIDVFSDLILLELIYYLE